MERGSLPVALIRPYNPDEFGHKRDIAYDKGQKGGSEDRLFLFLRHCHADADAQNFNSPMVFQSDSQMYWLAQRISFFIGIPPSIERFLHGFLYLQFSTWDGRMEGALDRFGETCYHKMQDSLYETESAQNMMVLKAYRRRPRRNRVFIYRRFETSGRQRNLPSFNLGIHSGAVRKD